MNERQHFEILLIEVMEMETVSVQQLQQQFCMGFNQAVRFMGTSQKTENKVR